MNQSLQIVGLHIISYYISSNPAWYGANSDGNGPCNPTRSGPSLPTLNRATVPT